MAYAATGSSQGICTRLTGLVLDADAVFEERDGDHRASISIIESPSCFDVKFHGTIASRKSDIRSMVKT